jgi:P-type E1-E2 ATPase
MIQITIPGKPTLNIHTLILDFNGTLACDGVLSAAVREKLLALKDSVQIIIATADTHGTARNQCTDLGITVETFPSADAAPFKVKITQRFAGGVACIGNGFNDAPMCKVAELSVAIIGCEGCWTGLLSSCDIAVTSIEAALELFLKPMRIQATLRT